LTSKRIRMLLSIIQKPPSKKQSAKQPFQEDFLPQGEEISALRENRSRYSTCTGMKNKDYS